MDSQASAHNDPHSNNFSIGSSRSHFNTKQGTGGPARDQIEDSRRQLEAIKKAAHPLPITGQKIHFIAGPSQGQSSLLPLTTPVDSLRQSSSNAPAPEPEAAARKLAEHRLSSMDDQFVSSKSAGSGLLLSTHNPEETAFSLLPLNMPLRPSQALPEPSTVQSWHVQLSGALHLASFLRGPFPPALLFFLCTLSAPLLLSARLRSAQAWSFHGHFTHAFPARPSPTACTSSSLPKQLVDAHRREVTARRSMQASMAKQLFFGA